MKDYSGVLTELAEGSWEEPGTGKRYDIGIKSMIIRDTLEGQEAKLVAALHPGKSITVVSDPFTHDAMGHRVFKALKADGQNVSDCLLYTSPSPRDS